MKVLILGAGGFTARHLAERLRRRPDCDLYFASRRPAEGPHWFSCDLTDADEVLSLVASLGPDQVYQLAGSFSNDYALDYPANIVSTKNLLDAVRATHAACRVLLVGSAAEYGLVSPEENPVNEDHALNPVSVYGLTKVYQTHLMRLYCALHRMDIVLARPFNLLGKNMSPKLFVGRVQQQVEAYLGGQIDKIELGNLRHRRDYVGVEKAVGDYELIMNHGLAGECYNVGSGRSTAVEDVLSAMLSEYGLTMEAVREHADAAGHKPDVKDIYADLTKLKGLEEKVLGGRR
jgi:GDP-4-dehydro-6-deoxy-D-mannose reductase